MDVTAEEIKNPVQTELKEEVTESVCKDNEEKSPESNSKETITETETELDKYWKAVRDNPQDFTGWTYLLQYVEQENNLPAARTAFEAFLAKYPYCYGYWKKFADMEKRNENLEKADEVFQKGIRAIALSIELWIHYLNFTINRPEPGNDHEEDIRNLFERALATSGTAFKSDKLWEMYLLWEKENSNLKNVTKIYDRLITIPTQLYSHHYEQLKEHINKHHPKEVLSLDEFLSLRQEVVQEVENKESGGGDGEDAAPPGADDEAPPGEDGPPGEPAKVAAAAETLSNKASDDKEIAAIREKAIEKRKEVFSQTEQEVSKRWSFEEGIRRPYFHVKALEKSQLKNWREYLDFEIENGSQERVMVLFERCVIACALYEEFWLKYAKYMEPISADGVRNVYQRACTIHLTQKPTLHLAWAAFEEQQNNTEESERVLEGIEKNTPGLVTVNLRLISLQRRCGNHEKVKQLFQESIDAAKTAEVKSFYAVKYARFLTKVVDNLPKAKEILQTALKADPGNVKLHLQLVDQEFQQKEIHEDEVLSLFDEALRSNLSVEHKMAFSQRKLQFLEDFSSSISRLMMTYEEHQKIVDEYQNSAKKRKNTEAEGQEAKKAKVSNPSSHTVSSNGVSDNSYQTDHSNTSYNYNQWGYGNNAYAGYSHGWGGYGYGYSQ